MDPEPEERPHGWEELSWDQVKLLRFDMDPRFGPCIGMTRRARYLRAEKFGLDPPAAIWHLLDEHAEIGDEDVNHPEWEKML